MKDKIKPYKKEYLSSVSSIWLETNIKAHNFINKNYWISNENVFKEGIEKSEAYVYFDEEVCGFIGLIKNYIAGIFVRDIYQNKGIGYALLEKAKEQRESLTLDVYKQNEKAVNFYLKNDFKMEKAYIDEDTNIEAFCMSWKRGI